MKCPKCQFENKDDAAFCLECGERLELECPQCGKTLPYNSKFCDKCGQRLDVFSEAEKVVPKSEAERKHVTVLFSDMSGYTALSEKLDPEEVKEIMSRVFGEVAQVVAKYEGFIEKFVGDAVMAIFGVPKAHEDDPVRAIRAAREIHDLVEAVSPEVEDRLGRPLSMHTGINTGLVVTGEVDMEKGTHGVAGDTINLAARLSNLSKPGEIHVGSDTYSQAQGYFSFDRLGPTEIKGKTEPLQVYKVLFAKERPVTVHRLSGLRADLIGRKAELAELEAAVETLRKGRGSIFSICGDAGTGKSRLIEEFKAKLDLEQTQWLEGHAYAYCQNIPYFPMIDLLNRVFQIEEGDPSEKVRHKVESGVESLVGKQEDIIPYLGSLYALSYSEVEEVSPEFWKSRLQDTMQMVLSALAKRKLTIFLLEDLHWADLSFVELLRHTLLEVRQPAIVLCVYRPTFTLFTSHQLRSIGRIYQEIRLQDLSNSEAQDMLESLLKSETIPSDLRRFVQEKAEGNPFYLEELVNSLIESETLIQDNGSWKVTRPISESEISSTIHGVISGRLDRLEMEMKRVLQEASVIGRAFFHEIIKRITELRDQCDKCLNDLERLDLIRTRALEPDLEYIFKHAMTQEVVYNGLLKKERKILHEKIGLVMEQLFQDRLPEFYETLAYHFKNGHSMIKAVDYLMKSGEKSVKRYAIEESHKYYKEAFDILAKKTDKSNEEERLLIDLLIKWAYVFYYQGGFNGLIKLFAAHENLAESLDDKARQGMFNAWLGFALFMNGKEQAAYPYLQKALKLGEESQNQQVIGYACTWLTWYSSDSDLLEEALTFGERAHEISKSIESDQYLYFKPLGGIALACYFSGYGKKAIEAGKKNLDFGQRHSNIRSISMGHFSLGLGHLATGNLSSAGECFQRAVQISKDPVYSLGAGTFLGATQLLLGNFEDAENSLSEVVSFDQKYGHGVVGLVAYAYLGVVYIIKGQMSHGLEMLEEAIDLSIQDGRKCCNSMFEHALGKVFLQIVQGGGPKNPNMLFKNIGFILKNVPFASKKAEAHFNKAIVLAKEIGAKGILGPAYLDLGLLHKAKKRSEQARECISEAIQIFEECEAEVYLEQAKEALASLE